MDPRAWFGDLTLYFVYVLFVATLGPLLFGFHLVLPSPHSNNQHALLTPPQSELNAPEDVIRCKKNSIVAAAANLPQCIKMTPTEWGVVGSMYTLGGLLGALSAGPMAGRYGRRRTMQITSIFFIVGPVFEALSPNIGVMAVGRLLSGVGAGASVVVVPIYISEIAPPAQKGFFGAFTQIMCNVGILFTQLLGYFLSHDQYWRIILAAGGVIGMLQSLGLLISVESPKFLAEQGHTSQAKKALRSIRGEDKDINEEFNSWGVDGSQDVNGKLGDRMPRTKLTVLQTKNKPCYTMTSPLHPKPSPAKTNPSALPKSSVTQITRKLRLPSS